ncbi:type I phosphodiesterase/nucleotide pyrophosphatase family protein [Metarhizium robertsii]|uniref:Alkaline phosphatase-like, alpha/beta/alpha n=2 Tax=Metarhizium robertsii TaxID=568076 RepID=E9ETQ5_METRA|nr:Alkaline phosphatase-like, alpha/beta/alpha [Metarhizium robertsii ARSEF 23]EFZ00808.1 Alkaline phosphatase-like, alpha/beta/alpha [Metarhizium robertsii ARSEF 23]EXV03331.1 type I phosphodiesterase/nucleotide pyrophosphatase family protein [Metarhizium robertsii]
MPQRSPKSKARATPQPSAPSPSSSQPLQADYKAIAEQWARAKRIQAANDAEAEALGQPSQREAAQALERQRERLNEARQRSYEKRWWWTVAFWTWLLVIHTVGIWLFTSGFLLTRLVLEDKSNCTIPPIESKLAPLDIGKGCWHPKTFDRAVVVIIDALRYDFTVPEDPAKQQEFHNAFPFLYETALKSPRNAFLRPFIADPPTTTLQRLKGLTTGTLPTFIDAGSNFAGSAIDEDNILMQLKTAGKKIAHLGDDTWWDLFPGYFEPNISKAYPSFNVPDLHTVDNGVISNIFPLMEPGKKGQWDLLIGHCLGVDHAGHRFGPNHKQMNDKLKQMDRFIRDLAATIDDNTLLVVMGDHGMDAKGDHGGESDDEVEAALWMYSKTPVFGRTLPQHAIPPATAKIRPVNQIDLVPTLSLLLGIPIPYNNLGRPIEEAFAGPKGNDWANLAAVSRMASAGIERYQKSYFEARGMSHSTDASSPAGLWTEAISVRSDSHQDAYKAFIRFQEETLSVCKDLWARFDVPRMIFGVIVAAIGVVLLVLYSSRTEEDEFVVMNDVELDYAEKKLEVLDFKGEAELHVDQFYHKNMLRGLWDTRFLFIIGTLIAAGLYRQQPMDRLATLVVVLMMTAVGSSLHESGKTIMNLLPRTFWGWLSVVFALSHSIGFASNSYTIWEDQILLFFVATFGLASAISAFRLESKVDRTMAIYHSVVFIILGRLASYSKLCREEQMPFCVSTYYATGTSTVSPWQLIVPFTVFIALPSIIKSFLTPTRSYEGLAPTWIGYVFRVGLFMSAIYWTIDATNNSRWLAGKLSEGTLKNIGVYLAQTILALALVAGTTAFIWAPPSVSIVSTASRTGQARVAILGYSNASGSRYLLLPINILAACLLLTKPMGSGALALMMWQILSLAEIVDLNSLRNETIGPVMLAILGNFYYFKTGHQAVLSSIQWDSAFIPLFTIRYPWTPIVVTLNTFAGQILAAVCVPLLALWKVGPKQKGVLETVTRSLGVFVAYYAVEALTTMSWAGWLRRHLMLYRVFCPRYMMAAVLLVVLDLIVLLVTLTGLRSNTLSIGEVFGWAD